MKNLFSYSLYKNIVLFLKKKKYCKNFKYFEYEILMDNIKKYNRY